MLNSAKDFDIANVNILNISRLPRALRYVQYYKYVFHHHLFREHVVLISIIFVL
jgi:hypothetical protein